MTTDFVIPSSLEELEEDSTKRFYICSAELWSVEDKTDGEIMNIFDDILLVAEENGETDGYPNYNQKIIEDVYVMIKDFSKLSECNLEAFGECLLSLIEKFIKIFSKGGCPVLKDQAKALIFFLQVFCVRHEEFCKTKSFESHSTIAPTDKIPKSQGKVSSKPKKSTSSNSRAKISGGWASQRLQALEAFNHILDINAENFWEMGIIPENFLFHMWKYALKLLADRPFESSSSTAQYCIGVLTKCSFLFRSGGEFSGGDSPLSPLSSAIVNSICQSENIIPLARDLSEICKTANPDLMAALLNDFGRMNMEEKSKMKSMVKNTQLFLVKLAESVPESMCYSLSLIIDQIDCDEYGIRNALLEVMGVLASYISNRNKGFIEFRSGLPTAVIIQDQEEETRAVTRLMRLYDSMCNHMITRVHDVKSYTRSTAIKVLTDLVECEAISNNRFPEIAKVALDRLMDKAVYVRKAAVALLTSMLDHNPFGGCLDINTFRQQKDEMEKSIAFRLEVLHADIANDEAPEAVGEEDVVTGGSDKASKQIGDDGDDESVDELEGEESNLLIDQNFQKHVLQDVELQKLKAIYASTVSAIDFMEIVDNAQELIKLMAKSKTSTDVVEAMRFFMRAVNFGLTGSMSFLTSTFPLVWHQEDSIKKQCVEAFKHVFLTDGATPNPITQTLEVITTDLIKLCQQCDIQLYSSLEEIIQIIMAEKDSALNEDFVDHAWLSVKSHALQASLASSTTASAEPTSPAMSLVAASLQLVSMISLAAPESMTERRVCILLAAGLCDRVLVTRDVNAMKAAAKCLQRLRVNIIDTCEEGDTIYNAVQHGIPSLLAVISGRCCDDDEERTRSWFSACEECMHALYHIHRSPEKVAAIAIIQLYESLGNPDDAGDKRLQTPVCTLSRLLFTLGQAALCSVVFTEKIAKLSKKSGDRGVEDNEKNPDSTPRPGDDTEEVGVDGNDANAMEEEMGLVAAADADHEKLLDFTTENELVCDPAYIFGKFHPLVAYIVANEKGGYSHPMLQETAVLALCRLMSVSSQLTETYLPLLFTVLEKYPLSPALRSTVMIAVGDLSFRFPNSLEPWTSNMYTRLSEKNVSVRYNSLMVLTHLILNDMVKIKGQVSQVVLCIVDPSDSVRGLAMLFFTELARRSNNPVYNLLGDIIGTLSSRSGEDSDSKTLGSGRILSAMEFQTAMTFLLKFVTKDKQADSLLERLLLRMETATSARQQRNLAFCVSQLPISEKGVRRMIELIKHYKDALHDREVKAWLLEAAAKPKRGPKAVDSARAAVDEFVLLVATVAGDGEAPEGLPDEESIEVDENGDPIRTVSEESGIGDKTSASTTRGKSIQEKNPGRGKKSTGAVDKRKTTKKARRKATSDDDDDEDDVSSDNDENIPASAMNAKGKSSKAGQAKKTALTTKRAGAAAAVEKNRPRRALTEVQYWSDGGED